jgi:Protein of unknown function (DUF935)/Phage Mu protein F like protein
MTTTDPQAAPRHDIGHAVGTGWSSGYPWDPSEENAALTWPLNVAVYDRMRRIDAQVKSVYNAVSLPIRRCLWRIDPNGAPDDAVRLISTDMGLPILGDDTPPRPLRSRQSFDWQTHIREAVLSLIYGHMPFEKRFEIRDDGLAHLVRLSVRMPPTIAKINTERSGDLVSIEQYPSGVPGDVGPNLVIPVDRLVMYSHEREGGIWQGQSMLRSAYRPFVMKERLVKVDAMKHERNGMGIPFVFAPQGASDAQMKDLNQLASKLRAGEYSGGAIPHGADIKLKGVEGQLPDTIGSIKYHDEQIAREALAQFLELVTSSHGSRALANSLIDFFIMALQSTADEIGSTFNEQLIEPWVDWNWGEDVPAPRLIPGEIGEDHSITADALAQLVTSGALEPDPNLDAWLRENYRMPARDEKTPWERPTVKPGAPVEAPATVAAGRADPKVVRAASPGNTEQAPTWKGKRYLKALVGHYGPPIGQALTALVDVDQAAIAWYTTGTLGVAVDDTELTDTLLEAWGEAYLAGYHAGDLMLHGAGVPPAPAPWSSTVHAAAGDAASIIDWATWTPGSNDAAALLAANDQSGGLAALLHNAGIVIRGIVDTTLDRIGNLLGDAVDQGLSVTSAAKSIREFLGDNTRAETIAQTEMARAMTAATLESYATNDVQGKQWLLSDGACELCITNDDDGELALDDDFTNGDPPVHPSCVCAVAPVVHGVADESSAEE